MLFGLLLFISSTPTYEEAILFSLDCALVVSNRRMSLLILFTVLYLKTINAAPVDHLEQHKWPQASVSPLLKQHHLQNDIVMIPVHHLPRTMTHSESHQRTIPVRPRSLRKVALTPVIIHGPPREELQSWRAIKTEVKTQSDSSSSSAPRRRYHPYEVIPRKDKHSQIESTYRVDTNDAPTPEELKNRPKKLKAFEWQRRLKEDQLYRIYKTLAIEWGELPRSSNYDAIRRLDRFLEEHSNLVNGIFKGDKDAIKAAVKKSEPKSQKTIAPKQPIDNMLRMIFTKISRTRPDNHPRPRWGDNLDYDERRKLVDTLMKYWQVQDASVEMRLYFAGRQNVDKYKSDLLSQDDNRVEIAAALLLKQVNMSMRQGNDKPNVPESGKQGSQSKGKAHMIM
jgi:hypothetical protein